jgi:hypothetical protein
MATLWNRFESPFFPFFNAVFRSPYYEPVNFTDRNFLPDSWAEHLVYPFHFVLETSITAATGHFRDARYAVLYVLVLFWLLRMIRTGKEAANEVRPANWSVGERFVLGFFVIGYVLWQLQFSILRYAITLESMAAMAILVLVLRIFRGFRARVLAVVVTCGILVLSMKPCQYTRSPWSDEFIECVVPKFENRSDVLVIIAHNRPFSFIVPYFQPQVRFVAVRNNLTKPFQDTRFQQEVRSVIGAHAGPILLLAMREDFGEDVEIVRGFDLAVADTNAIWIRTPPYPNGLGLWPLSKESE